MPERQNIEDVIRILYEIEKRSCDRHDKCCEEIKNALKNIAIGINSLSSSQQAGFTSIQNSQTEILAAINALVPPVEAVSAKLTLFTGGSPMGAPASVQVGVAGTSTFQEFSGPGGTGSIVPAIGPVTYASDTPAVATIDPNLGTWVAVSAGTANLSALDTGNGLTDTVALTVTAAPPPVAVSAVFTLIPNPSRRR
jgi:hypothetical protein